MRVLCTAACACATALGFSVTAPARANPAQDDLHVVAAVPVPDGATAATRLIGSSGQIYEPTDGTIWRRKVAGGVAADVTGAVADGPGILYAVADEAPIFRFARGSWHAHPLPNRGSTVLSPYGGIPTLGISRHVYTLRGARWVRWLAAPGRIAALWGSSTHRVYVADRDGKLYVGDGRKWRAVPHGLARDDRIVAMTGIPGKELYAIAASGAILEVGSTNAPAVSVGPELQGFRPALACPDLRPGMSGVLLLGTKPAPEPGPDAGPAAAPSTVLARAAGGKLTQLEVLSGPAPGDRFTAIYAGRDGELLLASLRGEVRLRATDGSWREGRVSGEVPEGATGSHAEAAPAHTR